MSIRNISTIFFCFGVGVQQRRLLPTRLIVSAVSIASILTTATLAQATNSGYIYVDPIARNNLGYPDPVYCSFWGAMNQALGVDGNGVLDPGCSTDPKGYGGVATGFPNGWTEIDLPACTPIDITGGNPPWWGVQYTNLSVVYEGDSGNCSPPAHSGYTTISGAGGSQIPFQVEQTGVLYFSGIELTGYEIAPLAINQSGGVLDLENVFIDDNAISGGSVIENLGGSLNISYSRIWNNQTQFFGIENYGSTSSLSITNTSITGNNVQQFGAGIYNNHGQVTLDDVTIGQNIQSTAGSGEGGAGIYNFNGTINIDWSTIWMNQANGTGGGGGILNANGTVILRNSILSNNYAPTNSDCGGQITSEGYNTSDTCALINRQSSDKLTTAAPLSSLMTPSAAFGPQFYEPQSSSSWAYQRIPTSDSDCSALQDTPCNEGAYQNGDQ